MEESFQFSWNNVFGGFLATMKSLTCATLQLIPPSVITFTIPSYYFLNRARIEHTENSSIAST